MKLSIIVIIYDMHREAPRTLHSLSRKYQECIEDLDYQVLVMDNGSPQPLAMDVAIEYGQEFSYHYIENAPKSPAYAINYGAQLASGNVLAIMIDGAHLLTPGVLANFRQAWYSYQSPIVATRRFYLGPGQQSDSMLDGYSQEAEDGLLKAIRWPVDGYRLFDIGCFVGRVRPSWRSPIHESNCFAVPRSVFESAGGANEAFDLPGGGLLNLDLLRECLKQEQSQLVVLNGEASFHQIHGGVSTNTPASKLSEDLVLYKRQYQYIRGELYRRPEVEMIFMGEIPKKSGAYFL